MKAKYFLLGLLASVALPIPCAYAELIDTTIFAFGDSNTGPNVTGTQIGNTTTITSHNVPVSFWLNNDQSQFGTRGEGTFNLTANSVGAATPSFTPGQFTQDYTGSFSITGADGFNYLSATFSEPLWAIDASANWNDQNQAQISQMWGYTGSWLFTSDVSGLASTLNEDDQQIYFLGLFDVSSLGITDGTLSSFTANATGNFSSTGLAMGTPEPSTWAMMLLGFVGLGYAGYRKTRTAAAFG
jgi:PEP-CTERM motif